MSHPEPITDCHDLRYIFHYKCSAQIADANLLRSLRPELITAEIQQSLFWDGGTPVGSFTLQDVTTEGHVTFLIERDGCEEDYHNCYSKDGHDGSDVKGIEQMQGEIDEAIQYAPHDSLLVMFRVEAREVIKDKIYDYGEYENPNQY